MNTEQKINNSIVEIDLIRGNLKGYCKAKAFRQQIEKLKELNKMEVQKMKERKVYVEDVPINWMLWILTKVNHLGKNLEFN